MRPSAPLPSPRLPRPVRPVPSEAAPAASTRPGLRRVQLVAPTSTDERIALAAAETDGWLYLVTVTGTTGARTSLSNALEGLAEIGRAHV